MKEKRMTDGSAALQEKRYRIITIEAIVTPAVCRYKPPLGLTLTFSFAICLLSTK